MALVSKKQKAASKSTSQMREKIPQWKSNDEYSRKFGNLRHSGHICGDGWNPDKPVAALAAANFGEAAANFDDVIGDLVDIVRIQFVAKLAGSVSTIICPGFADSVDT